MDNYSNQCQVNQYMNAIDKILLQHRNTKLFLVMMTGPFLIGLKLVSWTTKAIVLLFLYKAGTGHAPNPLEKALPDNH